MPTLNKLPLNQMNRKVGMLIQILNTAPVYFDKDRNAYCKGMVHSKSGSTVTLIEACSVTDCRSTNF